MYTIYIHFEQPGGQPLTLENIEPGQSLLEVCLKHDIGLHHTCGGVCSCGTCHLYIGKGMEHLEERSRREEAYIKRAAHPKPHSRLGCQCLLLEGGGEIEIILPNQGRLS